MCRSGQRWTSESSVLVTQERLWVECEYLRRQQPAQVAWKYWRLGRKVVSGMRVVLKLQRGLEIRQWWSGLWLKIVRFAPKAYAPWQYIGTIYRLRKKGFAWGTCACAAKGGHLEVLKWVRENGCSWDDRVCRNAAREGHIKVLGWAMKNGGNWVACSFERSDNVYTIWGVEVGKGEWLSMDRFYFGQLWKCVPRSMTVDSGKSALDLLIKSERVFTDLQRWLEFSDDLEPVPSYLPLLHPL